MSNLSDTEIEVLAAAKQLLDQGVPEVYGYLLAKTIEERWRLIGKRGWFGRDAIIGDGMLYRALDRLTEKGYLIRRKEDEAISQAEGRPGRYYYRLVDPSRLPGYKLKITWLSGVTVEKKYLTRERAEFWADTYRRCYAEVTVEECDE